jgi:hypothetical protein
MFRLDIAMQWRREVAGRRPESKSSLLDSFDVDIQHLHGHIGAYWSLLAGTGASRP